jgi:hypothetical protein
MGPASAMALPSGSKRQAILALRSGDSSDAGSYASKRSRRVGSQSRRATVWLNWGNIKPWVLRAVRSFAQGHAQSVGDQFKLTPRSYGNRRKASTPRRSRRRLPALGAAWRRCGPVARQLSIARNTLAENARLFALLTLSAADAIMAC